MIDNGEVDYKIISVKRGTKLDAFNCISEIELHPEFHYILPSVREWFRL